MQHSGGGWSLAIDLVLCSAYSVWKAQAAEKIHAAAESASSVVDTCKPGDMFIAHEHKQTSKETWILSQRGWLLLKARGKPCRFNQTSGPAVWLVTHGVNVRAEPKLEAAIRGHAEKEQVIFESARQKPLSGVGWWVQHQLLGQTTGWSITQLPAKKSSVETFLTMLDPSYVA